MSLFHKVKSKHTEADLLVDIPLEGDKFFRCLSSSGYLLLHPEMRNKAIIYHFIKAALVTSVIAILCFLLIGWLLLEIADFIYITSNYGFLH